MWEAGHSNWRLSIIDRGLHGRHGLPCQSKDRQPWRTGNLSIRCVPLGLVCVSLNVCVCVDDRRQELLKEWLCMCVCVCVCVCVVQKWLRETEWCIFNRKWAFMSLHSMPKLGSGSDKWDV